MGNDVIDRISGATLRGRYARLTSSIQLGAPPADRKTARHWTNRARGLAIWFPDASRYDVLHSLQVASGRSPLPERVWTSTLPPPRHHIRPHAAVNFASRTGDSYEPSAFRLFPKRNSLP